MFVLLFLSSALAFPVLESGQIIVGAGSGKAVPCEKSATHEVQLLYRYTSYQPQVIFTLQNYTHEVLLSDYNMELHLDVKEIFADRFTFELVCSKVKSATLTWYVFGGDTFDSGCFPLQERAAVTLEQVYLQTMQHAVFISGFAGIFKQGGRRPALAVFSDFKNQTVRIQVESNFQLTYVCYILAQDMTTATLNETEVASLVSKQAYLDDTLIMGLEYFQMLGNSFQFAMLNDKQFLPKQAELRIKLVKLFEPIYRRCPRVYPKCLYEGEPIVVCADEVNLTSIWKEFKSLQLFGQQIKFKLNIAQKDNILWLQDDLECSYDMYDQLMEIKIKNEPFQKEILKKRKLLDMLYSDGEGSDNVLTGQYDDN